MTNEELRMQMLAGVITESEYKAKLQENKSVNDIIRNLSSTYDLSTFESFKDEIEYSDLMDEIIAQMNGGVELDYNNMDQDEINNLVDPIKKQVDDYVFEKFNKKIFNKTSSFENKDSLNEHFIGMGDINSPFIERKKEVYEDAFEHFLGQKYELKEEMEEEMGENIADFLNQNMDEITSQLGDVFSNFETMGDPKVATAGDGEEGIDISFDKEHMLELFPEGDPYNKVESMNIAGKTVYYNDYR
jgi:hypothetical protein